MSNFVNSCVVKAVTSSLRQQSPCQEEQFWNPFQDHNYAKYTAKGGDAYDLQLEDNDSKLKSQMEKYREEIVKKNSQLAESAGVMINYQKVRKKLIGVEQKVKEQQDLLQKASEEKNELNEKLERFAKSVTNVCCGVTSFIKDLRDELISWCDTNQVQQVDRSRFESRLDFISGFVEEKIQAWLREEFITKGDLDTEIREGNYKRTDLVEVSQVSPPQWEDEEAKTLSVGSCSSSDPLPHTSLEEEDMEQICDLSSLPDNKEGTVNEDCNPSDKKAHAIDLSVGSNVFLCTCGAKCRSMSGLKLHVHQLTKPRKHPPKTTNQNPPKSSTDTFQTSCSELTRHNLPLCSPESELQSDSKSSSNHLGLEISSSSAEGNGSVVLNSTTDLSNPSTGITITSRRRNRFSLTLRPPGRPFNSKGALCFASPKSKVPCSSSTDTAQNCEKTSGVKVTKTTKMISGKSKSLKKFGKTSRMGHKIHPTKPLECCCGYTATHSYIVKRHVSYHKSDRKFACQLCPKRFFNNGYLNQHYRTSHKVKRPAIGVEVAKRIDTGHTSTNLSVKTESSKPAFAAARAAAFRALVMSKKRRSAAKRKRKLLRITAKERISCSYCHRRFPHIRDLAKHTGRRLHGGESFASRYSTLPKKIMPDSELTPAQSTPRRSSRIHTASTTKSTMSLYYYYSQKNYGRSSNSNDSGKKLEDQTAECCKCGKNCDKKSRKRRVPPQCTLCGHMFVCVVHLESHMKEKHNNSIKTEKICKQCGVTFKTEKGLSRHLSNKRCKSELTKKTTFPKKGSHSSSLNIKIKKNPKIHRQVKSRSTSTFRCFCGRVYSSRRGLLKHINEQIYGKIFKCTFCGIGFTKHFNLKKHVYKLHHVDFSEQAAFGCGNCGKTFSASSEYYNHRKTEHMNLERCA